MKNFNYIFRQCLTTILIIILFVLPIFSQNEIYTDKLFGKTFILTPSETKICIKFSSTADASRIDNITTRYNLSKITEGIEKLHYGVFSLPEGISFASAQTQLLDNSDVISVISVFIDQEGFERYIDPELFTVQFTDNISEKDAENIISSWGSKIAIDHWTPGYYTVTLPQGMNIFEAVRKFMDLPYIKFTEPASYGFNDLLDDTYLAQQWHSKNTGQETGYTVGNDINVFPAWNITFGDPDVILVIIDTGIDQTHPDLAGNILPRGTEDWDFGNREISIEAI